VRFLFPLLFVLLLAGGLGAENATPYSGTQIVETQKPFAEYLNALRSAVRANKMGIVAEACATCGAAKIGVTILGNQVVMIYHPRFAVRMLKASEASGIEAPLRLYVTEQSDGTARLTYRLPSHTFAPYEVPELDAMGAELDLIVAKIVDEAGR
jgi:uncharacterized protein (DUF302 family)